MYFSVQLQCCITDYKSGKLSPSLNHNAFDILVTKSKDEIQKFIIMSFRLRKKYDKTILCKFIAILCDRMKATNILNLNSLQLLWHMWNTHYLITSLSSRTPSEELLAMGIFQTQARDRKKMKEKRKLIPSNSLLKMDIGQAPIEICNTIHYTELHFGKHNYDTVFPVY